MKKQIDAVALKRFIDEFILESKGWNDKWNVGKRYGMRNIRAVIVRMQKEKP